jgi:hypothetical protein
MRFIFFAAALALSACSTSTARPATPQTCPAERAVYALRGAPNASLRLVRTPHALNAYSDLAARVTFEGETYWFAFTSSLGYSRNYIGLTEDPFEADRREVAGENIGEEPREPDYSGSELVSFDADFNVLPNVPQAGEPAPSHLLATGIGSAIWYSTPRRVLPQALWSFSGCDNA